MWFDKNNEAQKVIPQKYIDLGYPQSWKKHNKEFEHRLWSLEEARQLFEHPKLKKWKSFFNHTLLELIEKCDFARFAIMYIYGGIYADLDFLCLKNIKSLISDRSIGLVWEPIENSTDKDGVDRRLYSGFYMSEQGNNIWIDIMNYVMENYYPPKGPHKNTGPIALANFVAKAGLENSQIFVDTCSIMPYRGGGQRELSKECANDPELRNAYALTYWDEGVSWWSDGTRYFKMGRLGTITVKAKTLSMGPMFLFLILAISIVVISVVLMRKNKR